MKSLKTSILSRVFALTTLVFALVLAGCSERTPAELEIVDGGAVDPIVFTDSFGSSLDFAAFDAFNSYLEAISIDESGGVDNSAALRFTIPAGRWTGGWFYTSFPRDLRPYNALVLDAKVNFDRNLDEAGFGIGNEVDAFKVSRSGIPLTTEYSQVVIPIPNPSRLKLEKGMFWLSVGENASTSDFWFDNVRFADLGTITNPRPSINGGSTTALLGETVDVGEGSTTFTVNGEDITVTHGAAYYDFVSSDESILSVRDGVITAVGGGTATVTALLDGVTAEGELSVTVIAPPTEPAPAPTHPEADVISIYSDAYANNITVDTWRSQYSSPEVAQYEQTLGSDNVIAYTGLDSNRYVIIDFIQEQIDAAGPGMTHFHMDVFAPTGTFLAVKLVDFGPNGVYNGPGSDDSERELFFSPLSTPPFVAGEWVSLDIPLDSFTGMNFGNVAELVLKSANIGSLWIDNIYFHK